MSEVLQKVPRSIKWNRDTLTILDQTKLPGDIVFLQVDNEQDVYDAIKRLQVRGAPAIGIAGAFGFVLGVRRLTTDTYEEFIKEARGVADYLISARPTAVNLEWAINRVVAVGMTAETVEEALTVFEQEAINIATEDEQVCRSIGEYGLSLFNDGDTILTICNPGSLATSRYGTALAPFYLAKEKGWTLHAISCETRPLLQGSRLTTWELNQAGVPVTLITDSMAAHTLATKKVDGIIVGCDRVARNGDTANKIGTLSLAILAKYYGIPFYVAAPTSTIDVETLTGEDIVIEERSREEITTIAGVNVAPEGIDVFNPAFDVTPAELITGIITEQGIIRGDFETQIKSLMGAR